MNKFSNTSRYIYAILSALPIGIFLMFFGIKGVSITESKLHKSTGYVKVMSTKGISLVIKLNNSTINFNTAIPEHVELIKENIRIGDKITIYRINGKHELNYIEKLVKDGEVLIEFKKALLVPLISLFLGLIILIAAIVYLIQNPSDFFGGDKNKMEDFVDPWRKNKL